MMSISWHQRSLFLTLSSSRQDLMATRAPESCGTQRRQPPQPAPPHRLQALLRSTPPGADRGRRYRSRQCPGDHASPKARSRPPAAPAAQRRRGRAPRRARARGELPAPLRRSHSAPTALRLYCHVTRAHPAPANSRVPRRRQRRRQARRAKSKGWKSRRKARACAASSARSAAHRRQSARCGSASSASLASTALQHSPRQRPLCALRDRREEGTGSGTHLPKCSGKGPRMRWKSFSPESSST